jgi:alcohol dehydrogenase (cytochrome c)
MHEQSILRGVPAIAAALLALAAPGMVSAQSESGFVPVTDAMLHDPAPEDWLTWRRTLDGWGFRC